MDLSNSIYSFLNYTVNNSTASNISITDDGGITDDGTIDQSDLLMRIFSIISIVSCLLVSFTFCFPHLRNRSYIKVVLYINICNFFSSFGSVFGYAANHSPACYWEGVATNNFPISSVFWTIKIAVMLFEIVEYGKLTEINYITHLVCWCFPIVLTMLPFINASYAAPGGNGWCFVVPNDPNDQNMIVFWYW